MIASQLHLGYSPRFLGCEHLPSVILFTYPLSLNCSGDSVSAPQYSWNRDFIPLNDAITQGYFSTSAPGILVKNSLFKEDSGDYTCIVSNSLGLIHQSTYITILNDTRFIHEPSSGSFALAQDNYLVCEASVDEELSLSFKWLVDGILFAAKYNALSPLNIYIYIRIFLIRLATEKDNISTMEQDLVPEQHTAPEASPIDIDPEYDAMDIGTGNEIWEYFLQQQKEQMTQSMDPQQPHIPVATTSLHQQYSIYHTCYPPVHYDTTPHGIRPQPFPLFANSFLIFV
ncbi:Neuroglian-like [Oopsacas minuta]|uniref:Neuroglian-like n=1 Tax=Oopsacas minuta TaxID=111878 RepID=A0AAV7JSE5_9METZ|nr:Neuroglian-like [Oopsacas minuta]